MQRFWEVDSLRGIAIIMMIVSNFVTDLIYFNIYAGSLFWNNFAYATASIFLLLVGVSLTLSYSRSEKQGMVRFSKYLKRGMKIFSWGLVITAITWLFMDNGFILFGVLHLIGISIILAYPLIKFRYINILVGLTVIGAGLFLQSMIFSFQWLLWLGFVPAGFVSVDYFPLLPWFGVVLIGIFAGNVLYRNYERKFNVPDISDNRIVKLFCFLGRHSLLIYLIHQPVLIAIISLI